MWAVNDRQLCVTRDKRVHIPTLLSQKKGSSVRNWLDGRANNHTDDFEPEFKMKP